MLTLFFCSTLICVMALLVGVVVLPTDPNALHLPPADLLPCLVLPAPVLPMKCPNRRPGRHRPIGHHTHQLWVARRPTRSSSHAPGRCLTRALIRYSSDISFPQILLHPSVLFICHVKWLFKKKYFLAFLILWQPCLWFKPTVDVSFSYFVRL